jgi:hypothetical protein
MEERVRLDVALSYQPVAGNKVVWGAPPDASYSLHPKRIHHFLFVLVGLCNFWSVTCER